MCLVSSFNVFGVLGCLKTGHSQHTHWQDEDDAEMELALLEMFKLQGDIDASSLPKTGKV
jgi:hypothetical protein